MADLTALDEKLGEVLGLAQTAQAATKKVSAMEDADDFESDLDRMHEQAAETERPHRRAHRRARRQEPRSATRPPTPRAKPPR